MAQQRRRPIGKQSSDPIRKLYEELNQPGLAKVEEALRERNARFSNLGVAAVVQGSAQRQIIGPSEPWSCRIDWDKLAVGGEHRGPHRNTLFVRTALYLRQSGIIHAPDPRRGPNDQSGERRGHRLPHRPGRDGNPATPHDRPRLRA